MDRPKLSPGLLQQQKKPTTWSFCGCDVSKCPKDAFGSDHVVHGHLRSHGEESALQVSHITAEAAAHLLAVDPLQVEVLEPVDEEGTPQSQPDHGVPLGMDRQLLQAPHLSQSRQLHQLLDAAF